MALAGAILEWSFARLRSSMATFSVERIASRPFGRLDLVVMVESQGSREKVGRRTDQKEEPRSY